MFKRPLFLVLLSTVAAGLGAIVTYGVIPAEWAGFVLALSTGIAGVITPPKSGT